MSINQIHIINGPNLNLLGRREVAVYGSQSFESFYEELVGRYDRYTLTSFQSNHEGALIDRLQAVGFDDNTGIILNAGGFTHTSIALGDTVLAIQSPVIEVHISDIYQREAFRHHSYIKAHSAHFIAGKGLLGYVEAIEFLIGLVR